MLADPQQQEAADSWVLLFRDDPTLAQPTDRNHQHGEGVPRWACAGPGEGDPLDAAAIKAFMITAINQDTNPATAGNQDVVAGLSRFGRSPNP